VAAVDALEAAAVTAGSHPLVRSVQEWYARAAEAR
jgi:hypothetical protein